MARTPRARWRGKIFDLRTIEMLKEVERLSGVRLRPAQGSYSSGSASAGTHTGGGAVDLSVRGLTRTQILRVVKAMRQVGFASWWRTPQDGFQHHIHGIAVGAPDLPRVARGQIASARLKRNGLRSNKKDPQAFLKVPVTTWEKYKSSKRPVKLAYPPYPKAGAAAFKVGQKGRHVVVVQVAAKHRTTGVMTAADLDWVKRYERNRGNLGTPNQIVGPKTYYSFKRLPQVRARWRV
jgi:hypothetical protein